MYFNATSHAVNQTNSQLITGSALTQLKFCHIVWLIWSMANNRKTQDYGYNRQSGGNVAMMLHNNGELEETGKCSAYRIVHFSAKVICTSVHS